MKMDSRPFPHDKIVQADDLDAYRKAMEQEGGDLISRLTTQRYEFGWTALHFIAGNNAVRILDWILGEVPGTVSGGDDKDLRNAYMKLLTTKSSDSEIPLHLAAQEGHVEIIEKLLSVMDDKFPDQIGRIQCGNKNDDGSTPLLVAVEHVGGKSSDRVEKVLDLLIVKGGSNVAQKDSSGMDVWSTAKLMTNRGKEIEDLLKASQQRRSS